MFMITKWHCPNPCAGRCEAPVEGARRVTRLLLSLGTATWITIMLLSAGVARAQSSGDLTGTVSDPSGAVIPNANVTLTSVETGKQRTTTSNGAGIFDFPSLDVGDYNLSASATGFETYNQNGIVINVASTARADVHLAVG